MSLTIGYHCIALELFFSLDQRTASLQLRFRILKCYYLFIHLFKFHNLTSIKNLTFTYIIILLLLLHVQIFIKKDEYFFIRIIIKYK